MRMATIIVTAVVAGVAEMYRSESLRWALVLTFLGALYAEMWFRI